MKQPEISVVIPVHNTSKYLEQCVMSVMNQTFKNIEILCIDDGSTDHSLKILEKLSFIDERIIIFHREYASGSAAVPRNIGLEHASGKYIMFLDSDDYFEKTMLEKLYVCAERTGSDLIICDNYRVPYETGEVETDNTELHKEYLPEKGTFSYQDIPDTIFQISNGGVWHRLILKDILQKYSLRFQTDVPILDDIFFVNVLLIRASQISIVRERLIFYRSSRPGSQTSTIEIHKESIFTAFYALYDYLKKYGFYDVVKRSLYNCTLATFAWWLYSVSNYQVYLEILNLYRSEYFEKLDLMHIEKKFLYKENRAFYDRIEKGEYNPTLSIVLESILESESKIAIYGAGTVGRKTYCIIKKYEKHKIVLWCDKNADQFENPEICNPRHLLDCEFDIVIIAISIPEIIEEVKEYLEKIGIDKKKIYVVFFG